MTKADIERARISIGLMWIDKLITDEERDDLEIRLNMENKGVSLDD